mgnify:CR=1 FL=1
MLRSLPILPKIGVGAKKDFFIINGSSRSILKFKWEKQKNLETLTFPPKLGDIGAQKLFSNGFRFVDVQF